MVAKINRGASLYGALVYNQNKVDNAEATVMDSRYIIHSANYTFNIGDCQKSFEGYLATNQRIEKPVIHISLNPDPRDRVDDDTAKKIAEEYLTQMGYGKQPYILYKHEDIERTHYHIVTVCVDQNGKKISDKFERKKSMDACRELEKKYNLHIPSKKDLKEESKISPVNYQKGNLKNQIRNTVSGLLSTYKVSGLSEYKTLLELHGVTITQINGQIENKAIHGICYSAIDNNGKKIGQQLKASLFKKGFGYDALIKKFRKDKKLITEKNISFMKRIIHQCLCQCKDRTHKELIELLKKRGIDLILRVNKDSRIYGVTYVDHNTKTVLNGSKLGIEFSANNLNNFFANPYYIIQELPDGKETKESPTKEENMPFLNLTQSSDSDEEAWKKRMRKKKGFHL